MTIGTLPVKSVTPPDDLAGIYMKTDSGKLNASLLVPIGPSGQLHHDAARSYKTIFYLCAQIGLPLTYSYGGTYRTYDQQVTLFNQRYQTPPVPGAATKTWNGVVYSIRPGMSMAAVPGTSNHGWGIAVDFAYGSGPDKALDIANHPQWPAFKQIALDCGWSWEATSEPWHLRLVVGSHPTQTVLDAEAAMNPAPPPPVVVPPGTVDDMKVSVLVLEDSVPQATFLGLADAAGHFWQVFWVDGNDPKALKMLSDQITYGGAPTFKFGSHVSVSLYLLNKTVPSGLRGGTAPWTPEDFGAAPNLV